MERGGVNVVYGFVRWKIHCKATLVVRREGGIYGVTSMFHPETITQ